MSAFDNLKLAMIPSGFKEDTLYGVLPEPSNSSELITNGTFDTDSDWTKGTGWSISGGKAYFDNSTGTEFYQSLPTSAGKYIISFDLEITNGTIQTSFNSPSTSTIEAFTTSGTKSFEITTTSSFSRFRFVGLANSVFNIDNVSVTQIIDGDFTFSRGTTATRVNSQGLIEASATDVPRLDYSDGTCPSLLLEPPRTNKIEDSEDFTDASVWNTNSGSVSLEGGYLAPDGTNTAYKVTQGSNKAAALLFSGAGGILAADARSIFARTTSGTGQISLTSHNLNTNNQFTITEEWQRFEVNGTTSGAGATNFYAVDFRGSSTNLTEVILWGAQSEVGDYVSSYIPTTGTAVTRSEDFCDNAGNSTIFNSGEGVLYAEIAALHDDLTFRVIGLSDDTNSNIVKFGYRTHSNAIYFEVRDGNVSQAFQIAYVSDITQFHKVAIKFKENDFAMWIDGSEAKTDSLGTMPSGLTMINFDGGNRGANFLGKCKALLYFNRALTDAELADLTT